MIDDTTSGNSEDLIIIKLYKEYFPNGKVKLIGGYGNGMKFGIFREYNIEGDLVNGFIYKQDTIIAEGMIKFDGSYDGEWINYYKTGEILSAGHYENGQQQGKWIYYYKNGKKEQVGNFRNNRLYGNWTWFYYQGQVRRTETYNGQGNLEGLVMEFDSLGIEITKGEYFNGIKEGAWFYHVGDYKEVGSFTLGRPNGQWNYFYKNGKIAFSGFFDEGEPKGKHILYHKNGIKKVIGKYIGGEKHGNWKTYNERGEEVETIYYKRGEIYKINGFKVKKIEE